MMEGFDFIGFGAVTVLCYLCGEIIKCTKLDKKWIPALCGVFGGILGTLAFFFLPEGFTVWGFAVSGLEVGLGELIVCYAFGIPFYLAVKRCGIFKNHKQ